MKILKTVLCVAGLALSHAGWASQAASQTHSIWQGGTANLLDGQSFASAFDIGLFYDSASERLSNAMLTLNFVGSGQHDPTPLRQSTIDRRNLLGELTGMSDTYTFYADPLDSVSVVISQKNGQTGQSNDMSGLYGFTSGATSTTPVYQAVQQCHGTFVITCGTAYVHIGDNFTYDGIDGYKGSFSLSSALDTASLSTLAATSLLRYGFTVTSGGVALESATLSFTTSPIPEPGAASLTLAGMAALISLAVRRRIRRDR